MWQGWVSGRLDAAYAPPPRGDGGAHAARGGPHRGPRPRQRPRPAAERAGHRRHRRRGRRAAVQLRPGAARRLRARRGRSASATCSSPRAPAASWPRPGAPRTGGRSSTASRRAHRLDADTLEAIVMLESAGRADARASDDLRSAAGLTQILAETGQNLLGLHIDVKASERLTRGILRGAPRPGARGRPPARRRALRPGQGDRGDGALPGLRQGQARPRRPRGRLLPHGRRQPAAGADGLRQGRHPLRAALLRLEPAAPRGGVAQAGVARRRLLDLPVARARGQGDHAPVPRAIPRRSSARRCCSRTRPRPRRSCTRRRARRSSTTPSRSAARGRRASCASSTEPSSPPTG